MRILHHDLHILTGAYALDAVDGPERDRFEHHLSRCRPCDLEVRGLAQTTTGLAMAAAIAPPPQLRERVLAAIAVTRQAPPAAEHHPDPAARPSWLPRLATGVAAASLAVAVALGLVQRSTQHDLDQARAQNQAIAAVLTAPDARIATQATTDGGTATVVVSRAEQKIVFTTAGLPPLPASQVYELWLMGPRHNRPAGLLPAPSAGKTPPLLASGLVPGDRIGVTIEPAGGTSRPTSSPIVLMSLPA